MNNTADATRNMFLESNESKRPNMRKNLELHYQTFRGQCSTYYEPMSPKNDFANIWATKNVPVACTQ